jgi:hypothetical protein
MDRGSTRGQVHRCHPVCFRLTGFGCAPAVGRAVSRTGTPQPPPAACHCAKAVSLPFNPAGTVPIPHPVPHKTQPGSVGRVKSPTLQFSLESGSSGKSSSSLVRGVRLSSNGPPLLAGLVSLDLPLDPLWEFPRDRYTKSERGEEGMQDLKWHPEV